MDLRTYLGVPQELSALVEAGSLTGLGMLIQPGRMASELQGSSLCRPRAGFPSLHHSVWLSNARLLEIEFMSSSLQGKHFTD